MPMPQSLQRAPPVGLGVLAWRLAGRDPPQLLLAVAVVVPVVGHAQVALGPTRLQSLNRIDSVQ